MSSPYPMKVTSETLEHGGGTKAYHIYSVQTADGPTLVIYRWGKVGAFGEIKTEQHPHAAAARDAMEKKRRSKESNGYREKAFTPEKKVEDVAALRGALGLALFEKIGKTNLNFLDPDIDTSRMRDVDPPSYDEDGNKLDNARKADLSRQLAAEAERKRKEVAATLAAHPDFGRF